MNQRSGARRFKDVWRGVATALGLDSQGVFIPYRYAATLDQAAWHSPYAALEILMHRHEPEFRSALGLIDQHADALLALGREAPPAPRFEQDWFPRLDAAMAYAMVRKYRPRCIVEIGSGHSTRFLARAARDGGLDCALTAIDPAPRADIAGLAGVTLIKSTLQEAGLAPFGELHAGDILFVDSSHVLMPGSDVDIVLNRIIPSLRLGVLVHVHDIFLPDDYPPEWAWRRYNEQQGLAPLLLGDRIELLFASRYVATRLSEALTGGVIARLSIPEGAYESSLWLRRI